MPLFVCVSFVDKKIVQLASYYLMKYLKKSVQRHVELIFLDILQDIDTDQQIETSYSGLEDETSNILATSSLLDDKKDLFMVVYFFLFFELSDLNLIY